MKIKKERIKLRKSNLKLGIGKNKLPSSWKFSTDIVKDFDDHIEKSIPRFKDCHKLTTRISDFYLTENNSKYLDIGSTSGSLIEKISLHHNKRRKLIIKGVEIEKHFCDFSKKRLKRKNYKHDTKFYPKDVFSFLKNTNDKFDFITSLFTLQFIKPNKRSKILDLIYKKLHWGGGFVFFEKVRGKDARFHDILNFLINLEKTDRNFEPSEIYGKSMSLAGVMEPFTHNGNLQILKNAGFKDTETIFKYVNFQGYLCIK